MKKILTSLALVVASISFAQVGVNNDDPKATLDIEVKDASDVATNVEGILVPRVTATRAKNMGEGVPESTLVYIKSGLALAGTTISEVDGKGFYYFDTTKKKWVKIGGGSSSGKQDWEQIKYNSANGKYVMQNDVETTPVPKNTWLIVGKDTNKMVRLPKMELSDAGRMIVVSKIGSGNLTVQDYQGKVGGDTGSVMSSVSTVYANRGRTFIWDGTLWLTTNY